MYRPPLKAILPRLILGAILALGSLGAAITLDFLIVLPWWGRLLIYLFAVLLCLFGLRVTLIGTVMLYQRVASEETRSQCRFEPTCSQYMILALRKYGFLIGTIKGLDRIRRCHPPHGGVDYP